MSRVKIWLGVVALGMILGAGAFFAFVHGSGGAKTPTNTAAASHPTNLKLISPAELPQFVQGLLAQAQQASAASGQKPLTPAQAQAIVNQQLKALGVPALTK